jgi:hypothetical protein
MKKDTFSANMKIVALLIIFMCPMQYASAPTKDFQARMDAFRYGMKVSI